MEQSEYGVFADNYTCLRMVASWVEALHDHGSVTSSLHLLLRLVGARSLTLSTYNCNSNSGRSLLHVNPMDGSVPAPRRCPPLAHKLLRDQLTSVKSGGLFLASEQGHSSAAEREHLGELLKDHGISDVAVISLGKSGDQFDFFELHFTRDSARNVGHLTLLPPILASTWRNREQCIANRLNREALSSRIGDNADPRKIHLLDAYNPANLSRSEFRICSLLGEGMSVRKIADRLSVCPSTVRSHLRSIYAKTGTSGQLELLHRLTAQEEPANAKIIA